MSWMGSAQAGGDTVCCRRGLWRGEGAPPERMREARIRSLGGTAESRRPFGHAGPRTQLAILAILLLHPFGQRLVRLVRRGLGCGSPENQRLWLRLMAAPQPLPLGP